MAVRKWICLCLVGLSVSLSACARVRERSQYLRGPNPSLSDYQDVALTGAASETKVLTAYKERAGVKEELPPETSDKWQLVVRAGLNAIDEQCEKYIDAIFWADRDLRTARNQINLIGATTATLMGVFSASAEAIAATAGAFGFSTQGITNFSSGLLYEIEPSGIQKVVKRSQATYRQGVEQRMTAYNSRPAAVAAIQGYLSLCLPASIETQINEAVAASDYELVDGDKAKSPVPELKRVATVETVRKDLAEIVTKKDLTEIITNTKKDLTEIIIKEVRPTPPPSELDRPKGCLVDECLLTKSQAEQIQRALCLDTIDANFGSNTRDAIATFEASEDVERKELVAIPNRQLETKEWSVLLGVGRCGDPFKNALERFRYGDKSTNYTKPLPVMVEALANTLELVGVKFTDPKPQTFNATLRDAIGQAQGKMELKQTKQVTKELLDKLKELSEKL